MKTQENHSKSQAKAQLSSIRDMIANLNRYGCGGEEEDGSQYEAAQQAIQEDPLSVQVRSDWHNPGETGLPSEFQILLCTGGPAVRIIGTLSDQSEPESVRLEHQDWGTPWAEYRLSEEEEFDVLSYCFQFYFGA